MDELSLEHSKVWKIVHWWALSAQSIQYYGWKISEEFCVMTLKDDAKLKGKLTCGLKNIIINLVNFHVSSQNSESFCSKQLKI